MTANEFRKLAIGLPEASEQLHMNHPDFRVGGKIFATLWTDEEWGMVKLTPQQQAVFSQAEPEVFQPVKGAWGRQGCTRVYLPAATQQSVLQALREAWRNSAPKRLADQLNDE